MKIGEKINVAVAEYYDGKEEIEEVEIISIKGKKIIGRTEDWMEVEFKKEHIRK